MSRAKVEGHDGVLERDLNSKAIVNTDRNAFLAYKEKKRKKQAERDRIDKLESDVQQINTTMQEILSLLKEK